jgi:hypothetical protein
MTVVAMACAAEVFTRLVGGRPASFLFSGSFRDRQTDWDVTYGVTTRSLRVSCKERRISSGQRNFAVIGDSFVFGQGVADCEDVVSRLAVEVPDGAFSNYGIIGAGIEVYQLVARDMVGAQTTDAIVLFYGNDISEIVEHQSFFGILADSLSTFALVRKLKHALAVQALVGAPRNDEDHEVFNNVKSIIASDREYFYKVAEPGERKLKLFETKFSRLIRILAERVSRDRILVAVVPEATTVSKDVRNFVKSLGGMLPAFGIPGSSYDRIGYLSRREGVLFVDLFPKVFGAGSGLYFPHDLHWSSAGHSLAAKLIADAVVHDQGEQGHRVQ